MPREQRSSPKFGGPHRWLLNLLRVDRHEHIGDGCLGLEPFRRLLNDPRFASLPILIETEKSTRSEKAGAIVADPFDVKNLAMLKRLRGAG